MINYLNKLFSRNCELSKTHESKLSKLNEVHNEQSYMGKLPFDVMNQIFMWSGPQGTAQFGQSSELFYSLTNEDSIWKFFCCSNDPGIQNIKNLSWKQIYVDEIDFKKFLGGEQGINMVPGDIIRINVNTASEGLKGIHLKKLIKQQADLKCNLDSMSIYVDGKQVMNNQSIKPLNIKNGNEEEYPIVIII